LTIAVLSPAVWAARGARGLERIVVFVACGAAAVPVWTVIDRANSVGLLAPIGLVFLVALCRQRWGLVAVMVVPVPVASTHRGIDQPFPSAAKLTGQLETCAATVDGATIRTRAIRILFIGCI